MKFRVLHSSKIDCLKWNARVSMNNSEIYNDFHYLNDCTFGEWYGMIWGDYEKLLPYYQKRKWGFLPYVCMPPFCQKFDNSSLTESEFEEALDYLKKQNWIIDYRVVESKNQGDFELKYNYVLKKGNNSSRDLQKNYSTLLKKNLSKNEIKVCHNIEQNEVVSFLKSNNEFQNIHYNKYSKFFHNVLESDNIKWKTISAIIDFKIEAAIMAIINNHIAYLMFPHSSIIGRKAQAMSFLIDNFVMDEEIKEINFEGSSIESIANFYKQFGASCETYYTLKFKRWKF